jgi:hypothetical protein
MDIRDHLSNFRRWIERRIYERKLAPLEQAILAVLLPHLPKILVEHIQQWVSIADRFLRTDTWVGMVGKPGAHVKRLYLNITEEQTPFRYVKIRFRAADRRDYEFYCLLSAFGFAGFEYSPSCPQLSKPLLHIEPVEVLADFTRLLRQPEPIPLSGWVAEWVSHHAIALEDIAPPLPEQKVKRLLRQRRLNLPADYLELLRICDGFERSDYGVTGVSEMWQVEVTDTRWWVLAERAGAVFIVAREGDQQPRVYYFHHEHEAPSAEFNSFREALQYLIAQPNLP